MVGTENREILILENNGMSIARVINLKAVPVYLAIQGSIEVEYKIFVACRNGYTYQIKNGKLSNRFVIHIESKPVGLLKLEKTIILAAMNRNIYSFFNKGRINFTKQMPAEITDICQMEPMQCILVALNNGEIRLYNDKYHINTISVGE